MTFLSPRMTHNVVLAHNIGDHYERKKSFHVKARIAAATEQSGVVVDLDTHNDMVSVIRKHTPDIHNNRPPDSFARLFWDQQRQASCVASPSALKWHHLMIKWCIYLRYLSSSSYEALRQSGCISVPSQTTLRDYTHFSSATAGFSVDTDQQLLNATEIQSCPEWKKWCRPTNGRNAHQGRFNVRQVLRYMNVLLCIITVYLCRCTFV